ncbi:MAG: zinc ABC transporter substrate-binding protein [Frankiales bacterium]|nr:MAG: zinc ABC transporter substrate-binding protein [Frankiales bacterium]
MRLLPAALATAALLATASCGGSDGTVEAAAQERLDVTVGFYPYEFVAARVGGDDVSITNLTQPGGEPHDLELSPRQVASLQETDLVLYTAGFQPAVDEAVEQSANDRSLDLLTAVDLLAGSDEHGHEEEGEHAEEGEHTDEGGSDPHVWLDPARLATIGDAVAERLGEIDPDRAGDYSRRATELRLELEELDGELREGLAGCARTEIVTSHDAFGYLAEAYGLEQVPLAGLSPEDEASPKRLAEVARYAKENGVTTIFFEELVSPKVAESLAREVGATAQALNPLESPPAQGDYLTEMRANLQTLRTALDCP